MQENTGEILTTQISPEQVELVLEEGDNTRAFAYIISLGGKVIGSASFSDISEKGARAGFVLNDGHSDVSTASAIVKKLGDINQSALQKKVLFAVVHPNDTGAKNVFIKNGYRAIGRVDENRFLLELKRPEQPLLSILCISYNHEKYIGQTLQGMLAQRCHFDFTILLGDDCSTDSNASVIYEYYRQHPHRFTLFLHSPNKGIIGNAKFLLDECKSRYMAICDGDDYWTNENKLQRQVDLLEKHPEYTLCFHNADVLDEATGKREIFYKMPKTVFSTTDILNDWYVPTHSIVFRKSALNEPEWLWHVINLDYAFQLILSLHGDFYCFNEQWGVYRVHSGGVSQQFKNEIILAKNIMRLLSYFNVYSNFKHENQIEKGLLYFTTKLRANNKKFKVLLKQMDDLKVFSNRVVNRIGRAAKGRS